MIHKRAIFSSPNFILILQDNNIRVTLILTSLSSEIKLGYPNFSLTVEGNIIRGATLILSPYNRIGPIYAKRLREKGFEKTYQVMKLTYFK